MTAARGGAELPEIMLQDGVPLRRSGADKYWARCPFHQERKPSFQVRLSRSGYWNFRCWSQACGVKGNTGAYLRLTGREPPEQPETRREPAKSHYDPLTTELLTEAARHYNEQLLKHDEAVQYLAQRGVNPEQAAQWGIGYAPGTTLYRLLEKQLTGPELARCALLRHKRREDRLARRIIIPNYRPDGTSDWHTGRAIDSDNERPYLSVPGARPALLRLADPPPSDAVILVEGPFDLMAVQAAGYCGAATAGNPDDARLSRALRRSGLRRVLLLPDRDDAGAKWAGIIARVCRQNRITVRTLALPDCCQDPADALRQRNASAKAIIATAIRHAYTDRAPPAEDQNLSPLEHDDQEINRHRSNTAMAYNQGPQIAFFGHLADDPKEFGRSDNPPVGFSVAVNYRRYSSEEQEYVDETTFYRCTAFRYNAEQALRLQKGDFVWVSGSHQPREYEARDGSNRTSHDVNVHDMHAYLSLTKRDRDDDDRRGRDNGRRRNRDDDRGRGRDRDDDRERSRNRDRDDDHGRGRSSDDNQDRGRGRDQDDDRGRSRNRDDDRGRGGRSRSRDDDSPPRSSGYDDNMDVDDLPF